MRKTLAMLLALAMVLSVVSFAGAEGSKWKEKRTPDGWVKVVNEGGVTLGFYGFYDLCHLIRHGDGGALPGEDFFRGDLSPGQNADHLLFLQLLCQCRQERVDRRFLESESGFVGDEPGGDGSDLLPDIQIVFLQGGAGFHDV